MKVVRIDNINYEIDIPKEKVWVNYHITKHVLLAKREILGKIMDIESELINGIRSKQQELACMVNLNISQVQSCNKCKSVQECNALLENLSGKYLKNIMNIVSNDETMPTHVHSKKKQLTVIDQMGLSVIARERDKELRVLTFFSPKLPYSLHNMEDYKFKLLYSNMYLKAKSINTWKRKLAGKNPIYHEEQNWNIS